MTKPADHTSEQQPADLSIGDVLVTLSAEAAAADAPALVKLAPRGKVRTRDDRAFDFSPETLVARFDKDGIEVPVDLEHSLSAFMGDKSKGAIGWISKLVSKPDGLYGEVSWLDAGKAALKARTHRYISPTFRHDEFGVATWLHSVALVAAPALPMPALAHVSPLITTEEPKMTKLARLAAKLGLNEDASEDAMIAALEAQLETRVEKATHDEAVASLAARTTELNQLKADARAEKVKSVIEDALKAKKIVPAQREHYEKLCATDEGLDSITALFAATTPVLPGSSLDNRDLPETSDHAEISPTKLAAEAQAYQGEMKAKGIDVPIDQAVDHVLASKTKSAA